MTTLNLGVVDVPYTFENSHTTTGDVAEILEGKYHIIEIFYELYKDQIGEALVNGLSGSLENLMLGAPVGDLEAFASGNSEIEALFKNFLSSGEIERLGLPGVPTKAALSGRSSRFKKKINSKGRRVSFYDTGLYEGSFKSWVEGL